MKFGKRSFFRQEKLRFSMQKAFFSNACLNKCVESFFRKTMGLCISTRNDALLSRNGNNRVDFFQETGIIDMNLL